MLTLAEAGCWKSIFCCEEGGCDLTCLYCFLIGFALAVIICLIWNSMAKNRKICRMITVEDSEKGTFTINSNALTTFVKRITDGVEAINLKSLKLVETRSGMELNLFITASPDGDLLTARRELREQIYAELEHKLGVADKIAAINFETVDFEDSFQEPSTEN